MPRRGQSTPTQPTPSQQLGIYFWSISSCVVVAFFLPKLLLGVQHPEQLMVILLSLACLPPCWRRKISWKKKLQNLLFPLSTFFSLGSADSQSQQGGYMISLLRKCHHPSFFSLFNGQRISFFPCKTLGRSRIACKSAEAHSVCLCVCSKEGGEYFIILPPQKRE